jgi:Tol biopolymer transport system component
MPRLLPILGLALLGLGLLTGCAGGEEEGARATATPTAAAVATPKATPSPEATPAATATTTPGATATPTATPAAGLGKLAFVRDGNIWVLEVDSGQETQLTTDGQNWWPQWSADGEWIAFRKRGLQGEVETLTEVWVMRADGSGATLVAETARAGPIWAPDDDRLAYATDEGVAWLVDVDSGDRRQLSPPDWEVDRLAWLPDGKGLVLEMLKSQEPATPSPGGWVLDQGLWRVNADGTGLIELYAWDAEGFATVDLGTLSPDGRWLTLWQGLVSASLRADGLPLRIMPASGGEAREIGSFTLLEPGFVAWAPQGDRLAVVEGGGRETWVDKQIVVMQPDGSDRVLLSDAGRADISPAWSPDGQRIAFTSGESSESETAYEKYPELLRTRHIWVASSDGSGKRQLTDDSAYADGFPQWSADGARILFVRQQAEAINMEGDGSTPVEIWLMKADGSEQHKLVDGLSNGWFGYYGFVDWSQLLGWHR